MSFMGSDSFATGRQHRGPSSPAMNIGEAYGNPVKQLAG